MDKNKSDYWIKKINDKFHGIGFQTFSDSNIIFTYALINNYKIIYNKTVNSLQLYKKIAYIPEFEESCKKEELICSYGCELKSIDICIEDIFKDMKFEEELINKDWNKYCLKSTYHESDKHEFYVKVHKVVNAIPTGFKGIKELCFDCENFEGQNMNKDRGYLRCSLIGHLYEIVEIPDKFKQKPMKPMTIFDFI